MVSGIGEVEVGEEIVSGIGEGEIGLEKADVKSVMGSVEAYGSTVGVSKGKESR